MKKLLVILLLLFPVHGAWADEPIQSLEEDIEQEKIDLRKYIEREKQKAKEEEEMQYCKIRYEIQEKCALKSAKAKTDTAANLIYNSCMRKNGLSPVGPVC